MNANRSLRPARALLTPTWVVALAILAVNDHVLKQAMPGVVTGKLSDFAGMIVAPTLLACVLALRSRRGVLAAHVAIGAVFAAINLSRAAADAWCAVMERIAVPWEIVVDPTDLVALPALVLSWRVLVPAMSRPIGLAERRILVGGAAGIGLLVCGATSPRHRYPGSYDERPPQREGMLTIRVAPRVEGTFELRCDDGTRSVTEAAGQVYVFIPRPAADAECKLELLGVPGTFGPIQAWTGAIECTPSQERLHCQEYRDPNTPTAG